MTTPGRQPIPADQQELLSAYLDNQLGGVERAALERKLASDAALRAELDELRTVRQLLRDLPALAPPRSFTLSAAQARPRSLPLFGWLRASSAVAALLLLLTFLPIGGGASGPSAAMAPTTAAASAMQSEAQQDTARVAEATTAPAAAAGAAAPGSEPPQVGAQPQAALKATAPNAVAAEATAAPATAAAAAAEPTTAAADTGAAASEATAPAIAEAQPVSTRTAMTSGTDVIAASGSSSPGTLYSEPQQPVPGRPLPPLRWAQIALAALAVALGIGALLVRRMGR